MPNLSVDVNSWLNQPVIPGVPFYPLSDGPSTRNHRILYRWDHLVAKVERPADLGPLVVAAMRAAVVVPEREPRRWFSWRWRWENGLIDRLVEAGELTRPEPGWLAAR